TSLTFGMTARTPNVHGKVVAISESGYPTLRVKERGKRAFDIKLSVAGEHNAHNALAAAAIGLAVKISAKDVVEALEAFVAANKRMQVIKVNGIIVLNDTYNSNPDSTLVALATLRSIASRGKKIVVLADMLELGAAAVNEHRLIGESIAKHGVQALWTFGPLSRSTHDAATVAIKHHFEDKQQLCADLAGVLAPGDVVLVKGSRSMKMEEVVAYLQDRLSKAA
ncbi:MAG: hypothetical protein HY966_01000, partial [Ignavibacteriales bacterium]|nr:hypothetical protein [Ignavibacteriales bacterium]